MIHTDSLMEDANLQHIDLKLKNKEGGAVEPMGIWEQECTGLMRSSAAYWLSSVGWQVDSRCLFTSPIGFQGPRAARHGAEKEAHKSGIQSHQCWSPSTWKNLTGRPPKWSGKKAGRNQETPAALAEVDRWERQKGAPGSQKAYFNLFMTSWNTPTVFLPPLITTKSLHTRPLKHQQCPGEKHVPSTFTKPLGCHCYCYRDTQWWQTENQSHRRPPQTHPGLPGRAVPPAQGHCKPAKAGSFKESCCAFCASEQPLSRSGTHVSPSKSTLWNPHPHGKGSKVTQQRSRLSACCPRR